MAQTPTMAVSTSLPPAPSVPVRASHHLGVRGARTHSGRRKPRPPSRKAYALVRGVRIEQEDRSVKPCPYAFQRFSTTRASWFSAEVIATSAQGLRFSRVAPVVLTECGAYRAAGVFVRRASILRVGPSGASHVANTRPSGRFQERDNGGLRR